MRIAVLSDIHGNFEALSAVWEDLQSASPDEVICLGDTIGYGPDPERCLAWLRQNRVESVLGNHEWGLIDSEGEGWFNPGAQESLAKTGLLLSSESLAQIRELPRYLSRYGIRFVHGYPPDSVTTYLFQKETDELQQDMHLLEESICFLGHTHELGLVRFNGTTISRTVLSQGEVILDKKCRYLVNAGSVGQPRDGDRRAKWVLLETEELRLQVRYVRYDVEKTVRKILEKGFPKQYATRLR